MIFGDITIVGTAHFKSFSGGAVKRKGKGRRTPSSTKTPTKIHANLRNRTTAACLPVDEWLALRVAAWRPKDIREQCCSELPVRGLVELVVEGQQGPAAVHAVAGELELVHGVNVHHQKLRRKESKHESPAYAM